MTRLSSKVKQILYPIFVARSISHLNTKPLTSSDDNIQVEPPPTSDLSVKEVIQDSEADEGDIHAHPDSNSYMPSHQ